MPTETEIHTDLTWTPQAWDKFREMRDLCGTIGAYFGPALGAEHAASLGICVMQLLAAGPCRVSKAFDFDGLDVSTPLIYMGIVFHPDSDDRMATRIGIHHDELCADWPRTGTWSIHS